MLGDLDRIRVAGTPVRLGWTFLYAGITKLLDPSWSAGGFLGAVPEANPFGGLWATIAGGWLWLIDPLNAWGLALVGASLLVGLLVRPSAVWGDVKMSLYWVASPPLSHVIVVDDHVVYALLLFGLGGFGAGRIVGLDAVFERTKPVRNNRWPRLFLG